VMEVMNLGEKLVYSEYLWYTFPEELEKC